ncbi:MAG: NRDE family protein [Wenzhouxiangellaceae bacterium]|nr:NRDE family protein [Wenzhouxiangellaceae bacterium]
MCLILLAWAPDADPWLTVAANRDEFHDRETRALRWWSWPSGPLAGRDGASGGTWMAASRDGRFAAVTNFRDPQADAGPRTRGELPVEALRARNLEAWLHDVRARRREYAPFNLLVADRETLWNVGTHAEPSRVAAGVHALSNHLLDTPWPKSTRAARRFRDWLSGGAGDLEDGLDLLDDREHADEDELPDTGIGREAERRLSPPFIVTPNYGTRSSTVLQIGTRADMVERSFDAGGRCTGQREFGWKPETGADE